MEKWKRILRQSINDAHSLRKKIWANEEQLEEIVGQFPLRCNPYYFNLIKSRNDPIWRQCIPDVKEITDHHGQSDPLQEAYYSPIKGLIHRYPDRVLIYASNICAVYCRFCTRKRKVGREYTTLKEADFKRAIRYIREHKGVRDVILSGGDPLLLDDQIVERYLRNIRRIKHVEIIRVDSRVPCTLPQRITPKLCKVLKKYNPLFLLTHFNHPREITPQAKKACQMLADAGIVLGNQSVLLKGVNDDPKTLKKLGEYLLMARVRPYYIYVADAVRGTYHLRVPVKKAIEIMRQLFGKTSGLAIPRLIIDLENGGGKLPLCHNFVVKKKNKLYTFRNFEGRLFSYHDV